MCIFCETVSGSGQLGGAKDTDEEILRRYRWDNLRQKCAVYLLIVDGAHVPDVAECVLITKDVSPDGLVDRLLSITQGHEVVERLVLAVTPQVHLDEMIRLFWTESYLEENFSIRCVAMVTSPALTAALTTTPLLETAGTSAPGVSALDADSGSDDEEEAVDHETRVGRQMALVDVVLQAEGDTTEAFGNPFIQVKHSWTDLIGQDLFAACWPSAATVSSSSKILCFKVVCEIDELEFTDWMWRLVTQDNSVYRVKGTVQFKHTEGCSAVHCVPKHVDIRRLESDVTSPPFWHLTLLGVDLQEADFVDVDWLQQSA